jgi:hypothetical protein
LPLQVPSLNDAPIEALPPNTMVRFRCFVQDTYDPEIYLDVAEYVHPETGNRVGASVRASLIVMAVVSFSPMFISGRRCTVVATATFLHPFL